MREFAAVAVVVSLAVVLGACAQIDAAILGEKVDVEVINGGAGQASRVAVTLGDASFIAERLEAGIGAGPRLTVRSRTGSLPATIEWQAVGQQERWSEVLQVAGVRRVQLILEQGGRVRVVKEGGHASE
jgi:hypothetical protein